MVDEPLDLDDPAERRRAWDFLCSVPLAGRVQQFGEKPCFAQCMVAIYHPLQRKPYHDVHLGKPPEVGHGDLVSFRLDPTWEPKPGRVSPPALFMTVKKIDDAEFARIEDAAATWYAKAIGQYTEQFEGLLELHAKVREGQIGLQEYERDLETSREDIRLRYVELEDRRVQLEADEAKFVQAGGAEVVELLRQVRTPPTAVPMMAPSPPPNGLVPAVEAELRRVGHDLDSEFVERLLVAHFLSVATGFLVLFGGPPGAGKTTVARHLPRLLGEEDFPTAVRPGWLDATDLLGYLNPDTQVFQPTPVLRFIADVAGPRGRRPSILTLDEMNLARIENYAPDLLSELEYSRKATGGNLHLYGGHAREERLIEDLAAGASLADVAEWLVVDGIPPTLAVPPGLCVQGTLNDDATTHELSPKVRDRCLAVRVEHGRVQPFQTPPGLANQLCEADDSWMASAADDSTTKDALERWEAARALSAQPGAPPLSHRTARCFEHVPALCRLLELGPARVVDQILVLRLMVWMEISRRGPEADELGAYAERAEALGLPLLAAEVRALLGRDGIGEYVKYLV